MTRLTHERIGVLLSNAPAYKDYANTSRFYDAARVQSIEYSFLNKSTDIKSLGEDKFLVRGLQSPVTRSPDVSFTMNYLFSEGKNEIASNLYVGKNYSLFRNFFDFEDRDDINIFVVASNSDHHKDLISIFQESDFEGYTVIGIGNAFMSNWTYRASVGSLPSCDMSFVASTINFSEYDLYNKPKFPSLKLGVQNQDSPEALTLSHTILEDEKRSTGDFGFLFDSQMDPEISAVAPGDIKVNIDKISGEQGGAKINSIHAAVQSVSIEVPVERQSIYGLGSNYVFDRKLQLPITGTLSMSLILREFEMNGVDSFFGESNVYRVTVENKVGLRVLGNQGSDYVIDGFYYVAVFDDVWRRAPFHRELLARVGVPGDWFVSSDKNYFYVCTGGYEWGRIPLVDSNEQDAPVVYGFLEGLFGQESFRYESEFVHVRPPDGDWKKFAVAGVDLTSKEIQNTLNVSQGMNFDISRAQLKTQAHKYSLNNNTMVDVKFSFDITQEDGLRLYFQ